ncbi:endolytic transglycosylase MltG [bacterium]|nr:endolytic transglycosylase MltG [bacterium]
MSDEFSDYRAMEPQGGGPVVRLMKVIAVGALIMVCFLLSIFAVRGFAGWVRDALGAGDTTTVSIVAGVPVTIEIEPGSSAGAIGDVLAEVGVVESSGAFAREVQNRGVAGRLQAGTYEMETGMTIDGAIAVLLEGPSGSGVYRLTVIEGLTIQQTLSSLARQTQFEVREYEAVLLDGSVTSSLLPETAGVEVEDTTTTTASSSAVEPPISETTSATVLEGTGEAIYTTFDWEGLLWPDTYEISERASVVDILQLLADTTVSRVGSIDWSYLEALDLTPYDGLIIASLIEREAAVDDERPTIASVIFNRLELDMLLQIDATVVFALGGNIPDTGLTFTDLEIDSPYNTYLYPGLPPTPISGARLASLAAAAEPDETVYIYYVLTDPEGRHSFTDDFDEFLVFQAEAREAGVIP